MTFVGAGRLALVGTLRDAFEAAVRDGTLRTEVIEAPAGWGKTRIVQELYGQLALLQRHPPYWPATISGLHPVTVTPPAAARPDFLWWAVRGSRLDGVPRFAVLDGDAQVSAHAAGIATALRAGDQLWRRRVSVAVRTAGLLPGLGVVGDALELLQKGADAQELLVDLPAALSTRAGLLGRAYQRQAGRTLDVSGTAAAREAADATADALAAVSRLLPLALVVEDAHDLDEVTVRFLAGLPGRGAVGLLVVTGPPGVRPELGGRRHRLDRLDPAAMAVIARTAAPDRPDLAELVTAADGNPKVLTGLLSLPAAHGDVTALLGAGLDGLYEVLWDALPLDRRRGLAALSLLGEAAPAGWVTELAPGADLDVPGWLEPAGPGTVRFTEPVRYAVATRMRGTVLLPGLDGGARIAAARATPQWTDLAPAVREALLTGRDDPLLAEELARLRLASGRAEAAAALLDVLAHGTGAVAVTSAAILFETNRVEAALERLRAERDRLDPDSPGGLVARHDLAAGLAAAGRLDEALPLYRTLIADRVRVLGPTHAHTRAARRDLARALVAAHRLPAAVEAYEDLYDADLDALGPEHPELLQDANSLFTTIDVAGRHAEAAAELADLVPVVERVHGAGSPSALEVRENLGHALMVAGDLDRAVPLLEAVAADFEIGFGPEHPHTLLALRNMAAAYERSGRAAEAIDLRRRLVAAHDGLSGPASAAALTARRGLGRALYAAGRAADAVEVLERVLADQAELLGPEDVETLGTRHILGRALQDADRWPEAAEQFAAGHDAYLRVLGLDALDTLGIRHDLATALIRTGRAEEALPLLDAVLAGFAALIRPDAPVLVQATYTYGMALLHCGRAAEAVTVLAALAARLDPGKSATTVAEALASAREAAG